MRCTPRAGSQGTAIHQDPGPGQPQSLSGRVAGSIRPTLFLLFFVSGFCGLVYQVVWTRMAFAAFGIITPVLSVVISVFMLGLSLGSWAGGKWIRPFTERTGGSAALAYAAVEFCIGLGAFCVPWLFDVGQRLLQGTGESNSLSYLILSAIILAVSILPWCLCMGATFPFMMAYIREREDSSPESFSFLYFANVLGATIGISVAALILIEVFGFKDTLRLAAAGNFVIAVVSFKLALTRRAPSLSTENQPPAQQLTKPIAPPGYGHQFIKWVLFATGFASMAMEVVWTRAFAPVLKTQVYSFAMVVATYLAATFIGSWVYRRHWRTGRAMIPVPALLLLLCIAALLPVMASEACFQVPKLGFAIDSKLSIALLLTSICPFCGILGYLTPRLIDEIARGSPSGAGSAYAINVLGCILGPLVASYILLSFMGERHALILLSLPFFGFYFLARAGLARGLRLGLGIPAAAALVSALFFCRSFEEYVSGNDKSTRVRRDYAASVICVGKGLDKWLLVNGNSMTSLTPITKFMAHMPLAFHQGKPESALVICFGMGTTFRSALSWDVKTTAVELIPSVTKVFDFFFADAPGYLSNPLGRIVIDDGRRFLNRTSEKFDVIIVDPPPPVEAAGSSLLYSKEFYDLATRHLKPGGIIQAWVPENFSVASAALRSLCDSYPHVRCFGSVEGRGVHMLASMAPIPSYSPSELVSRMPPAACSDLVEWASSTNVTAYLGLVLANEIKPEKLLPQNPQVRITDDQPYNEYYLLRNKGWW